VRPNPRFSLFPRENDPNLLLPFSGRASSIATILGGSALYTWFKHKESLAPKDTQRRGSYERVKMEDIESAEPKGKA